MPSRMRTRTKSQSGHQQKQKAEQVRRIKADPMVLDQERAQDGQMHVQDAEASLAYKTISKRIEDIVTAVHQGLENALLSKICKDAAGLGAEKQKEVTDFVAKKLLETGVEVAVESASSPVMATLEIGSLAEGLHMANVKANEAGVIESLVKQYHAAIVAWQGRAAAALESLDGQERVNLARLLGPPITADQIQREFEERVEEAMILHGYSARDALDLVRAKLDGGKSPE